MTRNIPAGRERGASPGWGSEPCQHIQQGGESQINGNKRTKSTGFKSSSAFLECASPWCRILCGERNQSNLGRSTQCLFPSKFSLFVALENPCLLLLPQESPRRLQEAQIVLGARISSCSCRLIIQLIIPCHSFEGKSSTEKIPAAGTQDSLPDTRGGVVALQIPAQAHSWAAVTDISRPCHLWGCTEKLQTERQRAFFSLLSFLILKFRWH